MFIFLTELKWKDKRVVGITKSTKMESGCGCRISHLLYRCGLCFHWQLWLDTSWDGSLRMWGKINPVLVRFVLEQWLRDTGLFCGGVQHCTNTPLYYLLNEKISPAISDRPRSKTYLEVFVRMVCFILKGISSWCFQFHIFSIDSHHGRFSSPHGSVQYGRSHQIWSRSRFFMDSKYNL